MRKLPVSLNKGYQIYFKIKYIIINVKVISDWVKKNFVNSWKFKSCMSLVIEKKNDSDLWKIQQFVFSLG